MKKIAAFFLVTCLMIGLCACAKESEQTSSKSLETEGKDNVEIVVSEPKATTEPKLTFVIENQVVSDNEYYKLEITGGGLLDELFFVDVLFENKTSNVELNLGTRYIAVNGLETPWNYLASATIQPGESKEIKEFVVQPNYSDGSHTLSEYGITSFTDIAIEFEVLGSQYLGEEEVVTAHLYPYGEENVTPYVRESQPSDQILVDNEYLTIIATGKTDYFSIPNQYYAELYVVNKTDKTIRVESEGGYVINGHEVPENEMVFGLLCDLMPKSCGFDRLYIDDNVLKKLELELGAGDKISEIEFAYTVRPYDDVLYSGSSMLCNDVVTIKF